MYTKPGTKWTNLVSICCTTRYKKIKVGGRVKPRHVADGRREMVGGGGESSAAMADVRLRCLARILPPSDLVHGAPELPKCAVCVMWCDLPQQPKGLSSQSPRRSLSCFWNGLGFRRHATQLRGLGGMCGGSCCWWSLKGAWCGGLGLETRSWGTVFHHGEASQQNNSWGE